MLFRLMVMVALLVSGLPLMAAKEKIVHIGGIAAILTKSTSCNRDLWGRNDENACRCCITKHNAKGESNQSTFAYCAKSSKHCTDEAIANIARKEKLSAAPVDPDAFVLSVSKAANLLPDITVDERELIQAGTPAGELNDKTAVYLLKVAAGKDFVVGEHQDSLKKGALCIDARKSQGGAQTIQLFQIVLKADTECNRDKLEKTIFILKEMKRPVEEVANLEKIRQSFLSKYLLENNPDGLAIALAHQNLKYTFQKTEHFMSLLSTAPGKSIGNHLKWYLEQTQTKAPEEAAEAKTTLQAAFCQFGGALGKFHEENMKPKGAIFGNVIAHGDLHIENVFVDPGQGNNKARITLIDNETMAESLRKLTPISKDVIRIMVHSTSRFFGKSQLYKDFPKDDWREIFVEPFIRCYAGAYPKERLSEIKREFRTIYSSTGIIDLLKTQATLYNVLAWKSIQSDIVNIIDAIEAPKGP